MTGKSRTSSSRVSSPYTHTNVASDPVLPGDQPAEKSKTMLQRWVEPKVRNQASFVDHGFDRIGVVAGMEPLGTLPSVKHKTQRLKPEGAARLKLVKKSVDVAPSPATTPMDAVEFDLATPEPQVNYIRKRSDSQREEDDEYNPSKVIPSSASRRKSVSRPSQPLQSSPTVTPRAVKMEDDRLYEADRVVDFACSQAAESGRFPTAYALRKLYNDHRENPRVAQIIEAVYRNTASQDQQSEFKEMMAYHKREGRHNGGSASVAQSSGQVSASVPQFSAINAPLSFASRVPHSPEFVRKTPSVEPRSASKHSLKSPHKDHGHISKKHKTSHIPQQSIETNNQSSSSYMPIPMPRQGSVSSLSSLSSIDEDMLREETYGLLAGQNHEDATAAEIHAGNGVQPITKQRSVGPKLHTLSTSALNNNASASSSLSAQPPNNRSQSSMRRDSNSGLDESSHIDELTQQKRETAKRITNTVYVRESHVRSPVKAPDFNDDEDSDYTPIVAPPVRTGQVLRLRTGGQSQKRQRDESEQLSSPTTLPFQREFAPDSATTSRAGTPTALGRPSRKARTGSGLRVKTSPMKKKSGTLAGIPRASGERHSPVGNGGFGAHNQDDNDDYCASCGGNGDLVCCDGCVRSFHFRCVDPPMIEGSLPDTWFCNICLDSRNPVSAVDSHKIFGSLISNIQRQNPAAFHLPKAIREYFDNVKTGPDGEYEEGPVVSKAKNRHPGHEEIPDYLKLRDAKGNYIHCHACELSAAENRPIIGCSYCSLSWHLDCLDPPLANPPPPGRLWRCPCHVDDLLMTVPGSLGPAHRFRKIKGTSAIKPVLARGIRNNGHIEIENTETDDEEMGFYEQKEYGKVYILPEEGIKLDFISQVRRKLHNDGPYQKHIPSEPLVPLSQRSISEQQAALNLAAMATPSLPADNTNMLINAMISEAPETIVDLMAQSDAVSLGTGQITPKDKAVLLAMKALIERQLHKLDGDGDMKMENADEIRDEAFSLDGWPPRPSEAEAEEGCVRLREEVKKRPEPPEHFTAATWS